MKKMYRMLMLISLLVCSGQPAFGTSIVYDVENLGGSTWQYTFTVNNDALSDPIDEFTIWFDYGLYENLAVTDVPSDWNGLTFDPVVILGSEQPGLFDALALVSGIAPGASLGGFSVSFDWLGTGTPGMLSFDVVNPDPFKILDAGTTSRVPEPTSILLLCSGISGLVGFRFYQKIRQIP